MPSGGKDTILTVMTSKEKHAPWLPNRDFLLQRYDSYGKDFTLLLERLESRLKSCITTSSTPTFKGRVKNFNSYYRKLLRIMPTGIEKKNELPVISDIVGIRVICAFLEDIAEVERCLQAEFSIYEVERKGADRPFREFGYESTHILLAIPDDIRTGLTLPPDLIFEIQIRTILQDAWAEVEHELVYKSEFSPFDLPLKRKLASINASLSLADIIFQEIRDYQNKLNRELDKRRGRFYTKADADFDIETPSSDFRADLGESDLQEAISPYLQGTIDDLILEAIEAHNNGNLSRAVSIYSRIIESNPNPVVLSIMYKHRGMAYFAQSQYELALSDFSLSASSNPENFRAYYYIGIVYSVLGKHGDAVDNYTKSLTMNVYQPYVYFRRSQSYYHQGLYTEALTDLDKAVSLGFNKEEEKNLRLMIAKKLDI